ncbi:Glutathione transport system permease protein GsiC [bioreactor metagenome]|uniref:Glutathione transport system permease protein GsiC n=1 Tax=bioreactor metagenome TaxID=1076179 RepID=A0A644XL76_9ZZZZ
MFKFIVKRILVMIPVLIGVTFIIFSMMYITDGDPARMMLGDLATEEEVEALREDMGLNDPFFTRYFNYLGDLLHGDLGISYATKQPVLDTIMNRMPATVKLAFFSCLFAIMVGVPIGIISAVKQYSFVDNCARVVSLLGISLPNFWLALLLMLFFSVKLGWLPATGLYGPLYYIMPVVSISAVSVATFARNTRSCMLEVIRQDYIRTARAKGQNEWVVVFKHALRNALIPIITVIGVQFATALGGAVVNEQVFAIPGLGKLMVDSIKSRDFPVVQGGVLIIALMFSVLNLLIDLLYAFIDPRIKSQYINSSKRKSKTYVAHVKTEEDTV